MKESYREGVASHPGPQPCEGGSEAALEALERGMRRLWREGQLFVYRDLFAWLNQPFEPLPAGAAG